MSTQTTFSMEEAATLLRCSRFTLRDRVTRGEVPHHRTGRRKGVYFTQEDLDAILAGQGRPVGPGRTHAGRPTRATPMALHEVPPEFASLRRGAGS